MKKRQLCKCIFALAIACFFVYFMQLLILKINMLDSQEREVNLIRVNYEEIGRKNDKKNRIPVAVAQMSIEHELLLRRSKNNLIELRYNLNREFKLLKSRFPETSQEISQFQHRLSEQFLAALIDVDELSDLNSERRSHEATALQALVQKRLHHLQNPANCDKAKHLVCNLFESCGFGCQISQLSYCLTVAYKLNRTMILHTVQWKYKESWSDVFLPLSNTCVKTKAKVIPWPGEEQSKTHQAIRFHIVNGRINNRPQTGVPGDLASRIHRLHGNPYAWWNGQLLKYLMRPQLKLQQEYRNAFLSSGFQKPCVGVHVRRTDKIQLEAAYHSIEEYMEHVNVWFDQFDLLLLKQKSSEKAKRRVYLASDDPTVLPEARKKYPEYEFYSTKYITQDLQTTLVDIYMLSQCDYITCTFSSGFCRVAYELMQTRHADASAFFHSLDDSYYYMGGTSREEQAVYPHQNLDKNELSLEVDDIVGIAGNYWDGFSKGTRLKTKTVGLYPSYKMEKIFETIQCPIYDNFSVPVF